MRLLSLICFALLMGCSPEPDFQLLQPKNNYFPLKPGSIWYYKGLTVGKESLIVSCPNLIRFRDTVYAVLEERYYFSDRINFRRRFCRYDSAGNVQFLQLPNPSCSRNVQSDFRDKEYFLATWYRFDAELRKPYELHAYSFKGAFGQRGWTTYPFTIYPMSKNDTASYRGAHYYDCTSFYIRPSATDADDYEYLAPGIGLVKVINQTWGDGFFLDHYYIPGEQTADSLKGRAHINTLPKWNGQ